MTGDVGLRVCVFCGSNVGGSESFVAAARELGAALAARGLVLVYGGGKVGLMGQLADAVLDAGGEVVGVMPAHLVDREIAHPGLSRLEVPSSMHERKALMAELASGFIALPGGFGTFEEVIEILTWNQLGLMSKPVVFLDVDGFYTPLLDFFDRSVEARFVRPGHRSLAQRAVTVAEAIDCATSTPPTTPHKWIDLV
ncbi:MAG TPA: TIGR00730 family Rossman fold protein [Ilumatobacteraceae bacterium]|nr:TIGR00730 family Rossman fold protein [Ilumatobacteraceae bacterium]